MARTKEFDRGEVLERAMRLFWAQGYAATTTDDLLAAMGISRQSLYDTFGDKQALYDEALRCYHKQSSGTLGERLKSSATALEILTTFLDHFAYQTPEERANGCMGINATTSLGRSDPNVLVLARKTAALNEEMMAKLIVAAQADGDLAESINPKAASRFLYATLQGLTVRAQAGASPAELRDAADFAIRALTAM
jgi:TetR/AcrR family transcriptional regulator, transcriptional repressor for nem operon